MRLPKVARILDLSAQVEKGVDVGPPHSGSLRTVASEILDSQITERAYSVHSRKVQNLPHT